MLVTEGTCCFFVCLFLSKKKPPIFSVHTIKSSSFWCFSVKLPRCPCGSQRCERLADRQWGQVQCSVSPLSIDSSATSTVSSTPPQHSSRAFHFQGQQCSRSHERSWNASCCHSLPRDFSSTLLEFKAHILGITSSFFIFFFIFFVIIICQKVFLKHTL